MTESRKNENVVVVDHTYQIGDLLGASGLAQLHSGTWSPLERWLLVASYREVQNLALRQTVLVGLKESLGTVVPRTEIPGCADVVDCLSRDNPLPVLFLRVPRGQLLEHELNGKVTHSVEVTTQRTLTLARTLMRCWAQQLPHLAPTLDRIWIGEDDSVTLLGLGEAMELAQIKGGNANSYLGRLIWHLPPERLNEALDPKLCSDDLLKRGEVFVLASTAYSMLMGRHPFVERPWETAVGAIAQLRTEEPAELESIRNWKHVADVLRQALSADPENRHVDALAFAEALQEAYEVDRAMQSGQRSAVDRPADESREAVTVAARRALRRNLLPWQMGTFAFFALSLLFAAQQRVQPSTLLITSDPSGLHFAERVGHLHQPIGQTPIFLHDRNPARPIRLHVMDGDEIGPEFVFDASGGRYQDLGQCKRIHFEVLPGDFDDSAPP